MFGRKKRVVGNSQPQLQPMPVVTMNYYPNRTFEVVTLIGVDIIKAGNVNPITAANKLIEVARRHGADAIIGFRCTPFLNSIKWVSLSAYGTAIRFTDGKEMSGSQTDDGPAVEV